MQFNLDSSHHKSLKCNQNPTCRFRENHHSVFWSTFQGPLFSELERSYPPGKDLKRINFWMPNMNRSRPTVQALSRCTCIHPYRQTADGILNTHSRIQPQNLYIHQNHEIDALPAQCFLIRVNYTTEQISFDSINGMRYNHKKFRHTSIKRL
jgi:hypothetical protein